MKIRVRKGYKRHLQRRIKERNFKKRIKREYLYEKKLNGSLPSGCGNICTFDGYYIDERGTIKQINKRPKRHEFKNPRHYRRIRRHHFNKNIDDNITSMGKNYRKVNSKKNMIIHDIIVNPED